MYRQSEHGLAFVAEINLFTHCFQQRDGCIQKVRTGTRLNIGRPQVRWVEGIQLAQRVLQARFSSTSSSVTIGTILTDILSVGRAWFQSFV